MSSENVYAGFEDLSEELTKYISAAENSTEILLAGAEAVKKDLDKLTKPMSKIRKSGYTHLVDSFAIAEKDKEVVVGWEKYYGRMVERGTEKNVRKGSYVSFMGA